MMEVQKDHIKAAWLEANLRVPLVKRRVRRMNPEEDHDDSFLGK